MAKSKFAKFKKEIEKLILETLSENKRVILPNVGVLIAQGADRLVFNEFIKFNDNVLAKKIAALEKISQEEALFKLTAFIQELTTELANHSYFKLGKVGVFTLGTNGKLTFFQSVDDAEKFVRKPILDDPDGILPETENQEQVIAPPLTSETEELPKPKKRGRPKKITEDTKKEEATVKKSSSKKEEKKIAKVEKNIAKASEAMVSFDIPTPTEPQVTTEAPTETTPTKKDEVATPANAEPKEQSTQKEQNTTTQAESTIVEEAQPVTEPTDSTEKESLDDSTIQSSETEAQNKTVEPEVEKPKTLEEIGFKNKMVVEPKEKSSSAKAIEEEPIAAPEKSQSAVVIAATVVVLVCLAAIWFLVFQKKTNNQNVTINDITITEELSDESVTLEQIDSLEQALYPTDTTNTTSENNTPEIVAEPESNQSAAQPTESTNTSTATNSVEQNETLIHHVVAGSFSTMAKANQKVKELKAQGYSTAQIIGERNKMYSVSYGSFASKAEANVLLQEVKKSNSGAWYLKF